MTLVDLLITNLTDTHSLTSVQLPVRQEVNGAGSSALCRCPACGVGVVCGAGVVQRAMRHVTCRRGLVAASHTASSSAAPLSVRHTTARCCTPLPHEAEHCTHTHTHACTYTQTPTAGFHANTHQHANYAKKQGF